MSIHGLCHDEGMSGSCGLECAAFTIGECTIAEEVFENSDEEEIDKLLESYYGKYELFISCQLPNSSRLSLVKEMYGY